MKSFNKITAVLLCFTLLCTFICMPVSAVNLPQNVTAQDVKTAQQKVEGLFDALQKTDSRFADLEQTVYGMLYKNETLSSVFWGLYSTLTENESTLSALGIDISVTAVSNSLKDFPLVQKRLNEGGKWSNLTELQPVLNWQVTNKGQLTDAFCEMLAPLNELLYVLLCSGSYSPNVLVSVKGADGYANAVVPILKALSCPTVISQKKFTQDAGSDRSFMVKNIAEMIFAALDAFLKNPVGGAVKTLPKVGYYLNHVGLSDAFNTLISPLKVRVGLLQLSGLDKMLDKMDMFSDAGNLTDMLEKMDLSELTGSDLQLTLPDIDLEALAKCCTLANGNYRVDETQSFLVIAQWLIAAIKKNQSQLPSLLGQEVPEGANEIIVKLLSRTDDELLSLLLRVLTLKAEENILEYSWSYPEFTPSSIAYTPNLTEENYQKVLREIDPTLNEFLKEFGGGVTLSSIIAQKIYSPQTVTALVKGLFGAVYSEQTASVLPMLGLDISPNALATELKSSYPKVAAVLEATSDYGKISDNGLNWGFEAGSRKGFQKALTAVLTPFLPALDFLLCAGSINLMDVVTVYGSNGYNTAVIPLLEGLGCPDASVKTYKTFSAARGSQKEITYLIDPVLDLVDSLIDAPVSTLCQLLPNLLYFYNSGALTQCINNLLYPLTKLTELLGVTDLIPSELTQIGDKLSLDSLMSMLTSSEALPITLTKPDLTRVASLGQMTAKQSNRTYNNLYVQYTYITADAPAVLVTVLRYFINTLKSEENAGVLDSLMSGSAGDSAEGMPDMFAMYAGNITEKLSAMTTDETIEWLYDLLFAETPTREETTAPVQLPEIIYEDKGDNKTVNYALLAVIVVLMLLGGAILLSKVDFNGKKEKRERKRLARKKQKADGKNTQKGKKSKAPKREASFPPVFEYIESSVPLKEAEPEQPVQEQTVPKQAHDEPKAKPMPEKENPISVLENKIESDKEALKRKVRQDKAVKRAIKESKKADKYYEQALHEASKKR